jgi:hypothetical protein
MIGGVIKYFRFPFDDVLWKISYQNIAMLLASIPPYDADEPAKKEDKDEVVDGLDALQEFFK